jgi:tripartite-type tricarboxylate transporter receptor subunit TctC
MGSWSIAGWHNAMRCLFAKWPKYAWTVACFVAAGSAVAQPYPVKPVRMIIPAGPGGGVDTVSRMVGQALSTALGQPVIMDNRPGAGTMLASELTAKAPPDGYTLLMATNSHAINVGLHKNLRYDPVGDFTQITLVASVPYQVVVHPSLPVRSVKELIALARRHPGKLHAASAGTGSGTHLAFELLRSMAALDIVHVPYKSGTPAMVDLVGGHVQMMVSNVINSSPHVRAKRLHALAITSAKRSAMYPALPTVAEAGVPGYQADVWYGVMAPARIPAEAAARLNREIVAVLRTEQVREKLLTQGAEVLGGTPEQFTAVLKNDIRKWAKVTASLNLRAE